LLAVDGDFAESDEVLDVLVSELLGFESAPAEDEPDFAEPFEEFRLSFR
jgi:hypothetical protein